MKKNYLNAALCEECGGKCCKMMPGIAFPVDFKKPLAESLLKAFKSGNWAIDWYEGDPTGKGKFHQVYYVRPKVKGVKKLFDPSWGGECIFLIDDGCRLKPGARPMTCRMLEPITLKNCVFHKAKSKAECATAWLPYNRVILDAARKVGVGPEDACEHDAPSFLDSLFGYNFVESVEKVLGDLRTERR